MSTPTNLIGKILYAIIREEDETLHVYITPKDYYLETKAQADWTPQEALDAIDQGGFYAGESMEGVIEVSEEGLVEASEQTDNELRAYLKTHDLFEWSDEFIKDMTVASFNP
jgi:hypothetical protein